LLDDELLLELELLELELDRLELLEELMLEELLDEETMLELDRELLEDDLLLDELDELELDDELKDPVNSDVGTVIVSVNPTFGLAANELVNCILTQSILPFNLFNPKSPLKGESPIIRESEKENCFVELK